MSEPVISNPEKSASTLRNADAPVFKGISLRAKFLLAMVLVTSGLTVCALLIIRAQVTRHVQQQVQRDLNNSSEYLRNFERRRTELAERMVALVSDTPLLKALMTTRDAATIQDGTQRIADLSGAQLFLVSDPSGKILALHGVPQAADKQRFEKRLALSIQSQRQHDWWLVDGKLYEVLITPVSAGFGPNSLDVGVLACGFEIDAPLVKEIAALADSELVVSYKDTVVAATWHGSDIGSREIARLRGPGVQDTVLGDERFLSKEVTFGGGADSPVFLLLKSYDKATAFLVRLNWIVFSIGLLAVIAGSALAYFISYRFTMPLRELLTGVQALEAGTFDFPLHPRGHDESGQLTAAFARMREALLKSQEQLLRSARMEALGRLAGGVSHDFNNLITIISGYGELAMDRTTADPELTAFLQEIRKAAKRATGLTRQLLAFSRKQVLQAEPLDLNAVLANIHKMLRVLIGEDIQIVLSTAPHIPTVMADPGQIEQVVMNLAANARDAMPTGGAFTMTTDVRPGAAVPVPEGEPVAEDYVVLSVSDTGTGMSRDTIAHIFEPFFTTKSPGKGTGLGLATVYGIVRQSGGCLEVVSDVGQGTTFRIYLPAVARKASSSAELPHETNKILGRGVILVVEDEEPVRRLAVAGLRDRGYTVLAAANGREAMKVIALQKDKIDLVVSDVIMPEMGGRELFDGMKKAYPDIKVLFISGYTDRSLSELGVELETSLLAKPFTPHSLSCKVEEMLGRARV